jgi:hypothetical protein
LISSKGVEEVSEIVEVITWDVGLHLCLDVLDLAWCLPEGRVGACKERLAKRGLADY